jgi:homeobox protein cut-like
LPEFDLEGLRAKLDEQGLAVAAAQEASVRSRKLLADRTKDFRRTAAPEVSKHCAQLLKSYQEEVDRLTSRAKAGEAAFLELYRRLYEAPDPASALSSGLEHASRIADLEAQAAKMAGELGEYKAESKELKNQDLTIRKLEEKVRGLEAAVEERDRLLEDCRREAEAELAGALEAEAHEREERLGDELARAQAALEAMRRLHQSAEQQHFAALARGEEEAAAVRAELELATSEVERAQQQLVQLEGERLRLLKKAAGAGSGAEPGTPAAAGEGSATRAGGAVGRPAEAEALRRELQAQRDLAARAAADAADARQQAAADVAAWSPRCDGLRAALAAKEAHASALERELSSRPTQTQVTELRQQVRLLQAVGYNSLEEDAGAGGGVGGSGSLEAALMWKNRALEHDLTAARLHAAEARGEAEASVARIAELEAEEERLNGLVQKLEEDLLSAEKASGLGDGGIRAPATSDGGSEDSVAGEQTMLTVVIAQRDRLRARVRQLEESAAELGQRASKAGADAEAARADNMALVERLRFVQGYSAKGRSASASASSFLASGAPASGDPESGVVGRYMREYEDRVSDPFSDFRAKEREARRRAMSLQDRAAYALGSMVAGSKAARSVVFLYALVLHLAVFLVLARYSNRSEERMEALEELCSEAGKVVGAGAAGMLPGGGGAAAAVASITDPVMG